MKTITMILLFALLISGCRTKTSIDYAGNLTECLTQDDIEVLNEACGFFEAQLTKRYSNLNTGQAYKAFLQDISAMSIPPEFFLNPESKAMLEAMRSSKTFEKIWAKQSQLEKDVEETIIHTTTGQDREPQAQFDPYIINLFASYVQCTTQKNTRKNLSGYFEMIGTTSLISPKFQADQILQNISAKDMDYGLMRLSIAIRFYYDTALMLELMNELSK
jgi:hypothetical protein